MKTFLKSSLVALAILSTCAPAMAQQSQCGPREPFVKQLHEKYKETRVAMGLAKSVVLEVWANLETGTWTVSTTNAQGIMCIRSTGSNFIQLEEELPEVLGDPT